MSIEELFAEYGIQYEPPTEQEIQAGKQRAMLEVSVVTACRDCDWRAFGMRLGCASSHEHRAIYRYLNYQGQLLRPGRDYLPIEARPLTEWT